VALREQHKKLLAETFGRGAGSGIKLVDYMFENPIFSVHDVARQLKVSYVSANQLVAKMARRKLIKEITGGQRNRRFRYETYTQLFQ